MKTIDKESETERVAIIDHENHSLYIEDIPLSILEAKYNGEEELYIRDNYNLVEDLWSWDYIKYASYMPYDYDAIEINFDEL